MQQENLIALLTGTLKFYADRTNHATGQIKNDDGHLARFALDQVKIIDDQLNSFEKQYDELQNKITEKTPDEIIKDINDLLKDGR